MPSIRVNIDNLEWTPGSAYKEAAAVYDGKEIYHRKILSDRRHEGGGLALLSKLSPPPGKLIKIVAISRSDEHVVNRSGGPATKSGKPVAAPADYTLNPKGQPHSAMIAEENVSLVIYSGE